MRKVTWAIKTSTRLSGEKERGGRGSHGRELSAGAVHTFSQHREGSCSLD